MSLPLAFEKHHLIRFHHCDPACIVFYPEYLVIFDELIEDWFNEGMHINFAQLHAEQRIGIPAVRIEVDFIAPSKIGDSLRLSLVVKRIGNKSFTLMIEGSVDGDVRIRAVMVRVVAAIDGLRGVPIPDVLREKIAKYQVQDSGQ
ncbi:MAG: acyl-CoA thioesterase [Sulfuritalea sp.]|jgi:4-hydroxybenzoyl-CoA thioesterase|nr:acyl-CoA thioesterase [Sulfuritalea sp.]